MRLQFPWLLYLVLLALVYLQSVAAGYKHPTHGDTGGPGVPGSQDHMPTRPQRHRRVSSHLRCCANAHHAIPLALCCDEPWRTFKRACDSSVTRSESLRSSGAGMQGCQQVRCCAVSVGNWADDAAPHDARRATMLGRTRRSECPRWTPAGMQGTPGRRKAMMWGA